MAGQFIDKLPAVLSCGAALALGCSNVLKSPGGTFAVVLPSPETDSGAPGTDSGPKAEDAGGGRQVRFSTYLKAPSPQLQAQFGTSLAVDDATLLVTAPFEDVETPSGVAKRGGAVYVFAREDIAARPRRLVAPNVDSDDGQIPMTISPPGFTSGPYPWGGLRVALSGQSVVVGVPGEDSGSADPLDNSALDAGAVLVYDRAALDLTPQYLKASEPQAGAVFGTSISLSGTRLAVGAPTEDGVAQDSGAVYVYEQHAGAFDAPATRIAPETGHPADLFGFTVVLEGDVLLVGAAGDSSRSTGGGGDPNATDPAFLGDGAVYVYRMSNGRWTSEAYVKPTVAERFGLFGFSLSSLSNGRFAVGAPLARACPGEEDLVANRGAAYVVSNATGAWSVEQCLSPPGGPHTALFGWSIALRGDRLVVGAPWDARGDAAAPSDASTLYSGAASLYERAPLEGWKQAQYLKTPVINYGDTFGFSVALSSGSVVIGAQQESGGQSGPHADQSDTSLYYAGAVYLFSDVNRFPP
jgi:hypothetical protein